MTFADYLRSELKALDQNECSDENLAPMAGATCPSCKQDTLEYDTTLNLVCTECDYVAAGVCT